MWIASALLAALAISTVEVENCAFDGEPRAWTIQALEAWDRLDAERLGTRHPVTPVLTLFDEACVHTFTPAATGAFGVGVRRYEVRSAPHEGAIALPDGGEAPVRRMAMAFPTDEGMAFAMALPALWRANAAEPRDPDLLAMLIFMHEFAHTQQGEGLGARIEALIKAGLGPDIDDDLIQDRFAADPDYVAAFTQERDPFYAAAAASADEAETRRLALEAITHMHTRRAQWLDAEEGLLARAAMSS